MLTISKPLSASQAQNYHPKEYTGSVFDPPRELATFSCFPRWDCALTA
jgi:hypothetical protein